MESTEYIEYIREKLNEKGINMETQDYVVEYIEMNQRLFGSFLDISKVIDRIVRNLNHNVKAFPGIRSIAKKDGSWNAHEHTIYTNPLRNLSKKGKRIKAIIMHELDHCATTTYRDIGDEEKERYIAKCLNNSGSLLKRKKLEQYLNKHLRGANGKFPIVGIRDDSQLDYLNGLNEGITEYKNEKYCKFLGIKSQGSYIIEKTVAQFIAETIGEEKLISMHFNNDYEGIRNAFKLETGKDLDSLVTSMNFIIFQRQLSSIPLFVSKRAMIEEFNNYKVEAKHEERKDDTDRTKKLIDNGTIICGKIIQENGIVRFERLEPSQIDSIPEDERGFATTSMGRAIFTIDKDGSIHNFKGVDSHLSTSELGPMDLVNARSIEYAPRTDGYNVSAVVFNDKKPEIRINGTSPLEDIEIEGDINKKLAEMGIKVPTISYIREIPQDFSIKYGLPIKVDGSLDEFESDYAVEDDERKKRLGEIYGSRYSQELGENQRPESMREYLQRIGFLSSPEVQANIESLGYSMQDFIEAVDSSYSRGQRYGQAERIMGSPFRISDLETCIANGNTEQLQTIMDFSEKQNGNFTEQLAEVFGKNIAILMNNGWECENLIHRQDFSLTGEFCDDAYFDIFERQEEMEEKYKTEPYKADALMAEIRRKYSRQVMHIASCIKVVQRAMSMTGKSQEQIDSLLETFVGSFTNNLDLQKIGQLFQIDEKAVEEVLMREFSVGQNWTEKMAGQDRKEGLVIDEAIYNSHIGNEDFYDKVSGMITERIRARQVQKGKDGFADCIEDDKTRLSNMQNATRTTRDVNIEHTNDEQNLE